jgi:hypothetical protein
METVCGRLRQEGFWTEAAVLEDPALVAWAQANSSTVLTPFSESYPFRWLERLGSSSPPAAWQQSISFIAAGSHPDLKRNSPTFGEFLEDNGETSLRQGEYSGFDELSRLSCLKNRCTARYVGVVGGRFVSPKDLDFAFRAGEVLSASEYTLVSGGAQGCDSAARNGYVSSQLHSCNNGHTTRFDDCLSINPHGSPKRWVPPLILFPFGLERLLHDDGQNSRTVTYEQVESTPYDARQTSSCGDRRDQGGEIGLVFQQEASLDHPAGTIVATSLCSPCDAFSSSAAMERNRLIYAASEATLVVRARHRIGGSWHGAVTALRDRLCPVFVQEDRSSLAHRTLISLGAIPLGDPHELVAQVQNVGRHSGAQATLF